jgi:DNA-binding NtrC family response regulator
MAAMTETSRHDGSLTGLTILVVDDDVVVLLDIEATLGEHGAKCVLIASNARQAMRHLSDRPIDCALIDYDLGRDTVLGLAHELSTKHIPFGLMTGFGHDMDVPAPLLQKPFGSDMLLEILGRLTSSVRS